MKKNFAKRKNKCVRDSVKDARERGAGHMGRKGEARRRLMGTVRSTIWGGTEKDRRHGQRHDEEYERLIGRFIMNDSNRSSERHW